MAHPKWATPVRRLHLAKLFLRYANLKGWKLDLLTGEIYHPQFERRMKELVADWVADDREARNYVLRLQSLALHRLNERGSLRGTFNAISRTIYHDSQPQFYVEGIGISALRLSPFAKIRLASSFMRLHVDIGDILKAMSKNKRRKVLRYANALPVGIQREVDKRCSQAVRHYLS